MKQPDRKLRVALVTTYPPGMGTLNEYAFHFVNGWKQKEEVAELILLVDELPEGQDYPPDDSSHKPAVTIKPCWRFDDWKNPFRIRRAVRDVQPDVVIFNIQFATFGSGKAAAALGLLAPALVKAAGFPTIVLLHNIMETVDLKSAGFAGNPLLASLIRTFGTVTTRLLLTVDLLALTIPKYVEIIEQKYKTANVFLAPHGAFEDAPLPELDPPDGVERILTFGKFGTYKKVESLIEATQMLQANGHPDVELVIAGTDSPNTPGYLADVAERYAEVTGVSYTGYVEEEDVPTIFKSAMVVVFPYTSTTGSSGVLHQAGSYGKAVVLPRIGDFAEVVKEEGYVGEYFDPSSTTSLKEAIARVLDNPEHRRSLGRINYSASSGLTLVDVVDWYLLHVQRLLAEREN